MDYLPKDPAILVSSVNMLLRDEEFDTLESLCYNFGTEPKDIKNYLYGHGFVYSDKQKQFRPIGYEDSIETAYSFLHQKQRIYVHSTLDWQKDDIEIAIASFADEMNQELLDVISGGRADFLRDHKRFKENITKAVLSLESVLEGRAEILENML